MDQGYLDPGGQLSFLYSGDILPTVGVDELTGLARRIFPQYETVLNPYFFIASLSKGWIPRITLVRRGTEPVGLVYAREKTLGGWPTGFLFADGTFGNLVLAKPDERKAVLEVAIQVMLDLPRMKALRLLLPADGYELRTVYELARTVRMEGTQMPLVLRHACLTLPSSYDLFLNSLGSRTRRNFRYYRRQFESAGHQFVSALSVAELRDVATILRRKCRISDSQGAVDRVCNWLAALENPFACGLRRATGEWLSVAAGFRDASAATMLLQFNNDVESERDSLSLVLRGYFIESLIQEQIHKLFFWAGVGGALGRYVEFLPGTAIYFDCTGYLWSAIRKCVRIARPRFPNKTRQDLDWLAPCPADVLPLPDMRPTPV